MAFAGDGDSFDSSSHYLGLFYGQGQILLGSRDRRVGGGVSFEAADREPRFYIGKNRAQLVYEGYGDFTQSQPFDGFPAYPSVAFGGLAYARWWWRQDSAPTALYTDLGWGLQWANRSTPDLDSELNSTPVLDLGCQFRWGSQDCMVGFRYLHISNAGLILPNYGQNQLFLTFGFRY